MPNSGITRSQSLSNGAGQAALAALRKHSQPVLPPTQSRIPRSNSLMTSGGRSNSMKSYTYNPSASYTVGPVAPQKRYSSLNSRSSLQRPANITNRLGSINSSNSFRGTIDEGNDMDEEGDITVTTKTTKILDSFGRTKSITTETIKTLPDGSNIIETTTKNISRSSSRTGSLRNNSLSNANYNSINLTKIDEDLHDFDYSYQMDNSHLNEVSNREDHLRLNNNEQLGSPLLHSTTIPNLLHDLRSNSLDQLSYANTGDDKIKPRTISEVPGGVLLSQSSSPSRPLKSILKNKETASNDDVEFKDASLDLPEEKELHPYKKLSKTKEPLSPQPPRSDLAVTSPSLSKTSRSNGSPNYERLNDSPRVKSGSARASYKERFTSPPSSIKFKEEVETIPVYREQEEKAEADIYALAMKAAMKKVYGDRDPAALEQSNVGIDGVSSFTKETVHNLAERSMESSGYRYQSHNKEFSLHSMRESDSVSQTSRKQRAKEEKKNAKKLEKEKIKAEKKAEKSSEKSQKGMKMGIVSGFFGKNKTSLSEKEVDQSSQDDVPLLNEALVVDNHSNKTPASLDSVTNENESFGYEKSQPDSHLKDSVRNTSAVEEELKEPETEYSEYDPQINDTQGNSLPSAENSLSVADTLREPENEYSNYEKEVSQVESAIPISANVVKPESEVCPSPTLPLEDDSTMPEVFHSPENISIYEEKEPETNMAEISDVAKDRKEEAGTKLSDNNEDIEGSVLHEEPSGISADNEDDVVLEDNSRGKVLGGQVAESKVEPEIVGFSGNSSKHFDQEPNHTHLQENRSADIGEDEFSHTRGDEITQNDHKSDSSQAPETISNTFENNAPEVIDDSFEDKAPETLGESFENKAHPHSINPSSSRSLDEPIEAPVEVPIYSFDNVAPEMEHPHQGNGIRRGSFLFGKNKEKQSTTNKKKKGSFKEKFFKYFVTGYNNRS